MVKCYDGQVRGKAVRSQLVKISTAESAPCAGNSRQPLVEEVRRPDLFPACESLDSSL